MTGERAPTSDKAQAIRVLALWLLVFVFQLVEIASGETNVSSSEDVEQLTRIQGDFKLPSSSGHQSYMVPTSMLLLSMILSLVVILLESIDLVRTRMHKKRNIKV